MAGWNDICYTAGPARISINLDDRVINVCLASAWQDWAPDLLETVKEAWGLSEGDVVSHSPSKIVIRYNISILELYLRNQIVLF